MWNISYWLLPICVRHDKFHSWCPFLPLVTYRHLLVILFWLFISSNISATPIRVKLLNTFWSKRVPHAGIYRYIFVNTSRRVNLDFVIKSLQIHFLNVCSQCLWCSPFSVCCKIYFFCDNNFSSNLFQLFMYSYGYTHFPNMRQNLLISALQNRYMFSNVLDKSLSNCCL